MGLSRLGVSSIPELKKSLPKIRNDIAQIESLKPIYMHSFDLFRDQGTSHQLMQYEVAEALWGQLLTVVYPYAADWKEFLNKINDKPKKHITRDVWTMFFQFVQITMNDKNGVNTVIGEGVWPVLIEDFAKSLKAKYHL